MTRVLRYPRLSALSVFAVMACALGRDACVSASLHGWAQVLLIATLVLLQDTEYLFLRKAQGLSAHKKQLQMQAE